MVLIGWLLLILSGLGRLAGEVPAAETPAGELRAGQPHGREPATNVVAKDAEASAVRSETAWRRTRDGWERPSRWTFHRKSRPPALHPIVVGLLEMFLASTALIAFSEAGNRRSRPKPKPARWPDTRRR